MSRLTFLWQSVLMTAANLQSGCLIADTSWHYVPIAKNLSAYPNTRIDQQLGVTLAVFGNPFKKRLLLNILRCNMLNFLHQWIIWPMKWGRGVMCQICYLSLSTPKTHQQSDAKVHIWSKLKYQSISRFFIWGKHESSQTLLHFLI